VAAIGAGGFGAAWAAAAGLGAAAFGAAAGGFTGSDAPPGAGGGVDPSALCSSAIRVSVEDHYD